MPEGVAHRYLDWMQTFQEFCAARFDHRMDAVRSEFSSPSFSLRLHTLYAGVHNG